MASPVQAPGRYSYGGAGSNQTVGYASGSFLILPPPLPELVAQFITPPPAGGPVTVNAGVAAAAAAAPGAGDGVAVNAAPSTVVAVAPAATSNEVVLAGIPAALAVDPGATVQTSSAVTVNAGAAAAAAAAPAPVAAVTVPAGVPSAQGAVTGRGPAVGAVSGAALGTGIAPAPAGAVTVTAAVATASAAVTAALPAVRGVPAAATAAATVTATGIPGGRITKTGAFVNAPSYPPGSLTQAQANTAFEANSQRKIQTRRSYYGAGPILPSTLPSDLADDVTAGRRSVINIKPYWAAATVGSQMNPSGGITQGPQDTNVSGFISALVAGGVSAIISIWGEPYGKSLIIAEFQAMFQHFYGIISPYYPVAFLTATSSVRNNAEYNYYPGDAYCDICATDFYIGSYLAGRSRISGYDPPGTGLYDIAHDPAWQADRAVPPKPFGIYEMMSSTDPASGQLQSDATTFWHYMRDAMAFRSSSGLANSDVLIFNSQSAPLSNETAIVVADGQTDPYGGFGGVTTEYRNALFASMWDALAYNGSSVQVVANAGVAAAAAAAPGATVQTSSQVTAPAGAATATAAAPAATGQPAVTGTAGPAVAAGSVAGPVPAVAVTSPGAALGTAAAPAATVQVSGTTTAPAGVATATAAAPATVAAESIPAGVPTALAGTIAVTGDGIAVNTTAALALAVDPGATVQTSSQATATAGVAAAAAVAVQPAGYAIVCVAGVAVALAAAPGAVAGTARVAVAGVAAATSSDPGATIVTGAAPSPPASQALAAAVQASVRVTAVAGAATAAAGTSGAAVPVQFTVAILTAYTPTAAVPPLTATDQPVTVLAGAQSRGGPA